MPDEGSTSVELAQLVGQLDVAALRGWQVELAATVADLATAADMPWPTGPDDPTVALLRVIARIALAAPEARSVVAQQLIEALQADGTVPEADSVSTTRL